ncbi:MAG: hypothetical protein J0I99_00735 [Devosia sp.]|uniref:hypothetical protein n=1 Tax=Devosia sp. TaxID=1871048 RepID=UPI001AD29BAA|nr:hypothetical protein [Devosia sp.]MBN9308723.1 hypothetical protein [Devosia sp.]MBN9314243.1 hypothetical protein [Devosia sp.]
MQKINYQVMTGDADGLNWINDQQVRVGQTVKLTVEEAKYLEMTGQVEKSRDLGAQKAKATKAKVAEAAPPAEVVKE